MQIDRTHYLNGLLNEIYPNNPFYGTGNSFNLPSIPLGLSAKIELTEARLTISIEGKIFEGSLQSNWTNLIKESQSLFKSNTPSGVSFRFIKGSDRSSTEPESANIVEISSPLFDIYDDSDFRRNAYELLQTLETLTAKCQTGISESEGDSYTSLVKRYERSAVLRSQAIAIHGLDCVVCDLNFSEKYGEVGKNFIHIHHLERLADTGKRTVDPRTDLIPVCPNCHAMLHKKIPPYLPEELKSLIKKAGII